MLQDALMLGFTLKTRHLLCVVSIFALWLLPAVSPYEQVALAQSPPLAGAAERQRGIELYRQKNFTEAAQILKSAVKKNPADEQAWFYLGLALTQEPKELKNATKAFETAIKLNPNSAASHTGLSYVLLRRNKFSEALREAQTALRIEPGIANAHYVVGVVRVNEDAYEEALAEANEAIRLNPNLAAAYLLKSEALWGLYSGPLINREYGRCGLPNFDKPRLESVPVLSPEELEQRRKRRERDAAILSESAESLETYLKMNPSDPSAERWREQLSAVKVLGNIGKTGLDAAKHGSEVTTKARLLSKPAPQYTDEARRAGVRGTVVLRGILGADGKVRDLLILRGLPSGLSWQAVAAARQVKFTPAMIDGKPVSMFIQMEYCFDLY